MESAGPAMPIVFKTGDDPVEAGLIASLARPGGNATGVCNLFSELAPKLLGLLLELVPQARTIALLVNPDNRGAEGTIRERTGSGAHQAGDVAHHVRPGRPDRRRLRLPRPTEARRPLVIAADPLFVIQREQARAMLAARHAIPAISFFSRIGHCRRPDQLGRETSEASITRSALMLQRSSRERSRPISPSRSRRNSSWPSTSSRPGRAASLFHRRSSPAPTR